jgi:hypothetical protein
MNLAMGKLIFLSLTDCYIHSFLVIVSELKLFTMTKFIHYTLCYQWKNW